MADCDAALALDPLYVKAYQRRAAAHRALGAGREAAADWEEALRLEPDNRATAADRDAALDALMAAEKLAPPSRRVAVPVAAPPRPPAVVPAAAPAAVPVSGMKKLAVEEVAEKEVKPAAKAAVPEAAPVSERAQQPSSSAAGLVSAPSTSGNGLQSTKAPAAAPPPSSAPAAATKPTAPWTATPAAARGASTSTAATAAAAVPSTSISLAAPSAAAAPASLTAPRTSVEFESAWRSMAGDGARQAAYLCAIPPASLPTVFKNSLTAPVLSGMLRCLLTALTSAPSRASAAPVAAEPGAAAAPAGVDGETAVAVLAGLTHVARFDLMVMSVPSRERGELKAAWGEAEAALRGAGREAVAGGLSALRHKYRCA